MIDMNKCLGENFSMILSDHLIYSRPEIKIQTEYDPLVVALLKKRFYKDVEWVNKTFFAGQSVIYLVPELNASRQLQTEFQLFNEKKLVMKGLCDCINKMSDFDNVKARVWGFSITIPSLISKPNNIDLKNIPIDFNPIEYLLLNPDLVFSGQNAYTHYLSTGCANNLDYCFNSENFFVNCSV